MSSRGGVYWLALLDLMSHGTQTLNTILGRDSARSVVWGVLIVSLIIALYGGSHLVVVGDQLSYRPEISPA